MSALVWEVGRGEGARWVWVCEAFGVGGGGWYGGVLGTQHRQRM